MTTPSAVFAIVVRLPSSGPVVNYPLSRMMLFPEDRTGNPIRVPYAPRQIEYVDLAGQYVTLTRPGLTDALLYNKPSIEKLSFQLLLTDRLLRGAGNQIVHIRALDTINLFKLYGREGAKLRMAYSSLEAGSWRITDFGLTSLTRDEITDEVIQATATVELTQAIDTFIGTGPVTGGTAPPPPSTPSAGGGSTENTGVLGTHTVVAGETLWGIAERWYRDGQKWTRIADANGITDPRTLQIGKKLTIPKVT